MQFSKKQENFSQFFPHFWKLSQILNNLKKNGDPRNLCISEIT